MKIVESHYKNLLEAVSFLKLGHLIGVPTETVYGLAADATNDLAVARIYETKGRPQFNPLIVHVSSIEQAKEYAEFNVLAEKFAEHFWPGPLTLVLPLRMDSRISKLVTAGLNTVAIRFPAHRVIIELIKEAGFPLAVPSANPSGFLSPTKAEHVLAGFNGFQEPKLILEGGSCMIGLESTILDLTSDQVVLLRAGGIALEDLLKISDVSRVDSNNEIKAPGMLNQHYSPRKPLRINASEPQNGEAFLAFGPIDFKGEAKVLNLSPSGNLTEAAANLFSMLHELDQSDSQGIAVMP